MNKSIKIHKKTFGKNKINKNWIDNLYFLEDTFMIITYYIEESP